MLAGLLVVAAILRVLGSRFRFPLLFHADEWAVVEGAVDMAKRNSFEPPWSMRPDHVEMKVDYLVFAAYAAVAKGMSVEAAFALDPVPFYWLARLVTATFGVATVFLAYLVGARYSRQVGIVAAVLFALFPAFVDHAHYATPDVPLTFAVMLLVYALMRYTGSPFWGTLMLSDFATALAVAIKYPGAVGAVMIGLVVTATAIRDRAWTRIVVHGAAAIGASLGFLFLIYPTLFTNVRGVRRVLDAEATGEFPGPPGPRAAEQHALLRRDLPALLRGHPRRARARRPGRRGDPSPPRRASLVHGPAGVGVAQRPADDLGAVGPADVDHAAAPRLGRGGARSSTGCAPPAPGGSPGPWLRWSWCSSVPVRSATSRR